MPDVRSISGGKMLGWGEWGGEARLLCVRYVWPRGVCASASGGGGGAS